MTKLPRYELTWIEWHKINVIATSESEAIARLSNNLWKVDRNITRYKVQVKSAIKYPR
jgi:hypothetical protein